MLLVAFTFNKSLTPSETITAYHEKAMSGEVEETKEFIASDILTAFENGGFWHYGSYGNFIMEYKQKTKSVDPVEETEKITGETASVDVKIVYTNSREEIGCLFNKM
jgi:hypothetical protein